METDDNLFSQLVAFCGQNILIVGIGNTLKGDDGVGSLICQRLKVKFPDRIIDTGTVPENYIHPIIRKAPQVLLIVDAIDFGASAGTIKILRPDEINAHAFSTHVLSPRLFLDVIFQDISPNVYFVGIQPAQTGLNQPLSPQVSGAVEKLVNAFNRLLKQ